MCCIGQAVTGQGSGEVRVHFCVEAVTWNSRAGSHQREQCLTNSGSSALSMICLAALVLH